MMRRNVVGGVVSLPPPPVMKSVYSSRLGEPVPGLVTLFGVALFTRASRTCAGVAVGLALRKSAAAPATCGEAMDVPLIDVLDVLPEFDAEVMLEPGA